MVAASFIQPVLTLPVSTFVSGASLCFSLPVLTLPVFGSLYCVCCALPWLSLPVLMLPATSCVAGTSLGRFLHMLMVIASDPLYTCVDGASL